MTSEQIDNTLLDENPASEIEGFKTLVDLASNLRWSWTYSIDEIWKAIDLDLWNQTHNPWVILQTVSREKIKKVFADEKFKTLVETIVKRKNADQEEDKWFKKEHDQEPLKSIAYFCMEYMLSETLPIYSGGLGNVAGDQLKAASDLGVPVTAIGLMYQRGYFRQEIDNDGVQQAYYPSNNSWQLPTIPVRNKEGEWLRIKINLSRFPVWLRVWKVHVGESELYLLDSNDAANYPPFRGITGELYGGDKTTRLMQEIILGIGGWKLLEELSIEPQVCHLNEGHASFAVLARAHSYMVKHKKSFYEALTTTRAGNLFTTHTAVRAGFDYFPPELITEYLGEYAEKVLGISQEEFLKLGRHNSEDPSEPFNMAYLAIRCSGSINGVSQLHARVSRHLFSPIFQNWPTAEVPIHAVTNGIHTPTWDSASSAKIWTESCGKSRWLGDTKELEEQFQKVTDKDLWNLRNTGRKNLVEFTRNQLQRQHSISGSSQSMIRDCKTLFNENTLTLGFARRFATYKRPALLLHDPERLMRMLTNSEKPVQLIMAGKAHPADKPGQALIQKWKHFIKEHKIHQQVVFMSDYDMLPCEQFVQGVDVWLNMPRRPWEACGTSGMKVLSNGGLNFSELDGWWAEAYTPEVGWAMGDGHEHGDDPEWDAKDAAQLYSILEEKIIPEFYTRNANGIPEDWVKKMRKSMSSLTPQFSANRAVREYVESQYIPAARRLDERTAKEGALGCEISNLISELDNKWGSLQISEFKSQTTDKMNHFEVSIDCGEINPEHIQVQIFAEKREHDEADTIIDMEATKKEGSSDHHIFCKSQIPEERPVNEYTLRVIPKFEKALIPLETRHILWHMK